jgi:hypothetical protein
MKKILLFSAGLLLSNCIFAQYWTASGNNIYNSLPGYVGIGTGPSYPLDVAGTIHSSYSLLIDCPNSGGWGANFRGGSSISGNIVLQGSAGTWTPFWISGANNLMKIGGNGSTEPSKGAINIDNNGNVGVNTTNTSSYNFSVNGTVVCDGLTVKNFSGNHPRATPWADYVFDKHYQLPSIESVATYIRNNNHLPGIPSAAEIGKKGLDLAAMQGKLLEKIEQLTLYTIDLQREADQLRAENQRLSGILMNQEKRFAIIQQQIDALKQTH